MGWRERDYARFTDDERRQLVGSSTSAGPRAAGRVGPARGAGVAVLVSGVVFALGQLPRSHPLVPALHFTIHGSGRTVHAQARTPVASEPRPLLLPASIPYRSTLTLRAHILGYDGRLATLEARWGHGQWRTVGIRRIPPGGSFRFAVRIARRGVLGLRLSYPNGATASGRTHVR